MPNHELILILQDSDCNSVLHIEPIFDDYRYVRPKADILLIEKYGDEKNIENLKDFSDLFLKNELFDMVMSGHSYSWWRGMLSLNQLAVLQKVKSPLLIVQGGADLSVFPQKVDDMIARLRESEKENIEYIYYQNLDHSFKNSESQNE